MFVKSNIICNFVALANTRPICKQKDFLCSGTEAGTPIETPFELLYGRGKANPNRGFLLGLTQANQTCKTSLLGSCNRNYETKRSWINCFSGGFFFFCFLFSYTSFVLYFFFWKY